MTYRVELIQSEEGYAVSCPSLPGCASQGDTEEEALENIQSAISEYLAVQNTQKSAPQIRYVDVKSTTTEPFEVKPFEGLVWPEALHHTDKVEEWLAILESQDDVCSSST